mmetsp:Transcript_27902/g.44752  ORF Transcript_27902/g.44752 Transcript_27902/m.44752 type:complete len:290 (-) Transcript_27902:67-936(-)
MLTTWQHRVGEVRDLVQEEVVEDAIAAHDHDVSLVGRHAVHGAPPLDHLDRQALVEVWIDPVVNPSKLQRGLRITVDALLLGVADHLQGTRPPLHPAQDEQFAVAHSDDGNHWVKLPVDARAIVHDSEHHRQRAEALSGLERAPEHGDWTSVGVRGRQLCTRDQLVHGQLLDHLQQLVGQQRGVDAEVLDLRDTISNSEAKWGCQADICILVALQGLDGVGILVGAGVEAKRLVLVVGFGQLLLAALEVVQVLSLPLCAHKEGGRPEHAAICSHVFQQQALRPWWRNWP